MAIGLVFGTAWGCVKLIGLDEFVENTVSYESLAYSECKNLIKKAARFGAKFGPKGPTQHDNVADPESGRFLYVWRDEDLSYREQNGSWSVITAECGGELKTVDVDRLIVDGKAIRFTN